jgi:hypothetical protein
VEVRAVTGWRTRQREIEDLAASISRSRKSVGRLGFVKAAKPLEDIEGRKARRRAAKTAWARNNRESAKRWRRKNAKREAAAALARYYAKHELMKKRGRDRAAAKFSALLEQGGEGLDDFREYRRQVNRAYRARKAVKAR